MAVHVRPDALTPHATSLMPGRQPFGGSIDNARAATITIQHPLAHVDDPDLASRHADRERPVAARLAAVAAGEPSAILVVGTRGQGRSGLPSSGRSRRGSPPARAVPVMIVPDPDRPATGAYGRRLDDGRPAVAQGDDD